MSTSREHTENLKLAQLSFERIDQTIRGIDMEAEQSLVAAAAATPGERLQRVLKIYRGIKPLLTALSVLPLIPATWRAAITLFVQTIEALAASVPDGVAIEFKAGKDLRSGQEQE